MHMFAVNMSLETQTLANFSVTNSSDIPNVFENVTYFDFVDNQDISEASVNGSFWLRVIMVLIATWIVLSNGLIFLAVVCSRNALKNNVNLQLLSLSFTDMLVGITTVPAVLASIPNIQPIFESCAVVLYLYCLSQMATLYHTFLICVHRLVAIKRKSNVSNDRKTFKKILIQVFGIWVGTVLFCVVHFLAFARYGTRVERCSFENLLADKYQVAFGILTIPTLVPPYICINIIYVYLVIFTRHKFKREGNLKVKQKPLPRTLRLKRNRVKPMEDETHTDNSAMVNAVEEVQQGPKDRLSKATKIDGRPTNDQEPSISVSQYVTKITELDNSISNAAQIDGLPTQEQKPSISVSQPVSNDTVPDNIISSAAQINGQSSVKHRHITSIGRLELKGTGLDNNISKAAQSDCRSRNDDELKCSMFQSVTQVSVLDNSRSYDVHIDDRPANNEECCTIAVQSVSKDNDGLDHRIANTEQINGQSTTGQKSSTLEVQSVFKVTKNDSNITDAAHINSSSINNKSHSTFKEATALKVTGPDNCIHATNKGQINGRSTNDQKPSDSKVQSLLNITGQANSIGQHSNDEELGISVGQPVSNDTGRNNNNAYAARIGVLSTNDQYRIISKVKSESQILAQDTNISNAFEINGRSMCTKELGTLESQSVSNVTRLDIGKSNVAQSDGRPILDQEPSTSVGRSVRKVTEPVGNSISDVSLINCRSSNSREPRTLRGQSVSKDTEGIILVDQSVSNDTGLDSSKSNDVQSDGRPTRDQKPSTSVGRAVTKVTETSDNSISYASLINCRSSNSREPCTLVGQLVSKDIEGISLVGQSVSNVTGPGNSISSAAQNDGRTTQDQEPSISIDQSVSKDKESTDDNSIRYAAQIKGRHRDPNETSTIIEATLQNNDSEDMDDATRNNALNTGTIDDVPETQHNKNVDSLRTKHQRRVLVTFGILLASMNVFMTPLASVSVIEIMFRNEPIPRNVKLLCIFMAILSSALNPIINIWRIRPFRMLLAAKAREIFRFIHFQ